MAKGSFLFDRLDLSSKLTSRRRLQRQPQTSEATPDPLGLFGPSQPEVSYEEFIEVLENEPKQPPSSHFFPAHDFPGESFPFIIPLAGPSHVHGSSFAGPPPVIIESAWMKDDDGNDYYVGHGKIEEVDDEADIDANNDNGDDDNDLTPRAKKSKQLSPHFSDNESHPETIPYNSTPPPGPRPRRLPSLKATTTLSEIPDFNFNFKAIEPEPTEPDVDSPRVAPAEMSPNSTGVLDDATEVSYVKENLELLESCTDDIHFMTTYFLAQEEDLSQHIDICTRIEESLRSLHETMTHRTKMGAEEWSVRSPSWHQKYSKRLVSLRTTLHRLSRLRKLIGNLKLRPSQAQAILTKLGQHEAKLADLASKYTTSFDRLRLRHLHFLLSQSNMEAKQQKEMRLKSRASFERQWKAGKDFRAGLRHAFNELRQEFYSNNQRSPSAP